MEISDFDFALPENLIAQSPAMPRDHSRLMVINRKKGTIEHKKFFEVINFLTPNDILVINNTKVFPARFFAKKIIGGNVEVLLIEEVGQKIWKALTRPGLKEGQVVTFKGLSFKVIGHESEAVTIKTDLDKFEMLEFLEKYGHTPLPPYIHSKSTEAKLKKEYQTVYAKVTGSVAAPTAGFHFTPDLLQKIKKHGIQIENVTLHVGLGTFLPVKSKKLEDHPMHFEYFEVKPDVARRLNKAKRDGKRIVAVGTTTTRVLETLASGNSKLKSVNSNSTNLFIYPPYKFKFVDALITNFHLPKSTLLALVSAFVSEPNAGAEFKNFNKSLMGHAYSEAIKKGYRFYSFGDACLII